MEWNKAPRHGDRKIKGAAIVGQLIYEEGKAFRAVTTRWKTLIRAWLNNHVLPHTIKVPTTCHMSSLFHESLTNYSLVQENGISRKGKGVKKRWFRAIKKKKRVFG
jgi:hypothetical protein